MTDGYDATAKLVNEEIAKLGDAGTFAELKTIDKKLGLPKEAVGKWVGMLITSHRWMMIRPLCVT